MKLGALNHVKMLKLEAALEIDKCFAIGVVESLWLCARETYPSGFLPLDAGLLARSIHSSIEPEKLACALVECGWIHPCAHRAPSGAPNVRTLGAGFVIHDWAEHCDDSTHRKLARLGQLFWDGSRPSTARLSKSEKAKCEKALALAERHYIRPEILNSPNVRTSCAPNAPNPTQPYPDDETNQPTKMNPIVDGPAPPLVGGGGSPEENPPDPPPDTATAASRVGTIRLADLSDRARVEQLAEALLGYALSDGEREGAWRAAQYALATGADNPPGLFRSKVETLDWPDEIPEKPDPDARSKALGRQTEEAFRRMAPKPDSVPPEVAQARAAAARERLRAPRSDADREADAATLAALSGRREGA